MKTVRVKTSQTEYDIYIDSGIWPVIESDANTSVLVVSNETVFPLYGGQLLHSLAKSQSQVEHYIIPDGEEYKSWAMAEKLLTYAMKKRLSRKSCVIAIGGGVVGDLAGFVASVYMRGIRFIQVPTTLLAQVDSSVGGKVAVNHQLGKNMIGSFYQPESVWINLSTLQTLDEREWRAGLAEVLKYGILWDKSFFQYLTDNQEAILNRNEEIMGEVVARCCKIKAEIVSKDEKEQNLRAVLNFGHTIGHAIERATNYKKYRHGEAISIGMIGACQLAHIYKMFTEREVEIVRKTLSDWGLPVKLPEIAIEKIIEGIAFDKKTVGSNITFVLPTEIGKVEIVPQIDVNSIKEALQMLN